MAAESISGTDVVTTRFAPGNPAAGSPPPREETEPRQNNTQPREEIPENNRGTRIDTYA